MNQRQLWNEQITDAFNQEPMNCTAVMRVVKEMREANELLPMFFGVYRAIDGGSCQGLLVECHQLRANWRGTEWTYAQASKDWLEGGRR